MGYSRELFYQLRNCKKDEIFGDMESQIPPQDQMREKYMQLARKQKLQALVTKRQVRCFLSAEMPHGAPS